MLKKSLAVITLLASCTASANLIEPSLIKIPGGEFMMGSENGQENERPVHRVTIKPFYASKYEVTVKEFAQFINDTGFKRDAEGGDLCWTWHSEEYIKPQKGDWHSEFNAPSEFHPVMCITGDQAKAYVNWLKQKTGKPYRLLSEAEWEYAARANSKADYFFGDDKNALCRYGNVFDEKGKQALERDFQLKGNFRYAQCDDNAEYTNIVGMYLPNQFGLYDTIGNVAELVADCEHTNYLNAPTTGEAWVSNCALFRDKHKMLISRGGAYGLLASPSKVRSAYRAHFGDGNGEGSSTGEGFRIAMDYDKTQQYVEPASTKKFLIQLKQAQQHKKSTQLTMSSRSN